MQKVLVISTIIGKAGRNCLDGIFGFANKRTDWSISFIEAPEASDADLFKALPLNEFDGIIVGLDRRLDLLPRILEQKKPTVMVHDRNNAAPDHLKDFVLIKNDDLAIGRMAAQHLLHKGKFASFVYVPTDKRTSWSIFRERGFHLELGKHEFVPRRWDRARQPLEALLTALPLPIGIMGATDNDAMLAIDACRAAHLRIPHQAAIISVDDDEMICESIHPQLSSIRTNDRRIGELAARALNEMMNGLQPKDPAHIILVEPTSLSERASTRAVPSSGHLVQTALKYIRSNVARGITVEDVVNHLNVSPSLARKRFDEILGKSIRDVILEYRLALVQKKLCTTTDPITKIAKSCGFSSVHRLSHLFHDRFSVSPTDFREQLASSRMLRHTAEDKELAIR